MSKNTMESVSKKRPDSMSKNPMDITELAESTATGAEGVMAEIEAGQASADLAATSKLAEIRAAMEKEAATAGELTPGTESGGAQGVEAGQSNASAKPEHD